MGREQSEDGEEIKTEKLLKEVGVKFRTKTFPVAVGERQVTHNTTVSTEQGLGAGLLREMNSWNVPVPQFLSMSDVLKGHESTVIFKRRYHP